MASAEALAELRRAWLLWEIRPGHDDRARAMEDAAQAVAAEEGITATELRVRLARARAVGSIDVVLEEYRCAS